MTTRPAQGRRPRESLTRHPSLDDRCDPAIRIVARPHGRPRTHHVHVCAAGGHHERRRLLVRELLRADAGEAARYEARARRWAGGP